MTKKNEMLEYQIKTLSDAVLEAEDKGWPSVSGRLDLPCGRTSVTVDVRQDVALSEIH